MPAVYLCDVKLFTFYCGVFYRHYLDEVNVKGEESKQFCTSFSDGQ